MELKSESFGETWKQVRGEGPWPVGIQVWQGKMFAEGKLLVPEEVTTRVIWGQHSVLGHCGQKRLVLELGRRFTFSPLVDIRKEVAEVKRLCRVCQQCDPENFSLQVKEHPHPIIDQFWASICMDLFKFPTVIWQGEEVDCLLLCVDRLTGWMVGRPVFYTGLSGEKVANLLVDNMWGELGVPAVITTDQDSRFISKFFLTMCGRLGIRLVFSQLTALKPTGEPRWQGGW